MSIKQTSDDLRVSVLSVDSVDEEQGSPKYLPSDPDFATSTKSSVLWNTTWKKVILGAIMAGIVLTLGLLAGFGVLHGTTVRAAVIGSETLHSYPLVRILTVLLIFYDTC